MKKWLDVLLKCVAVVLVCAVLAPSPAYAAPKPVNPETIHDKLVKRGVGNWVCIDEKNGVALVGRITSLEEQAFGMQLDNYPEVTMVNYADVRRVRNIGLTAKGAGILIAAGVGGSVALALIAHNAMENNQHSLPPMPASPGLK